MLELKNVNKVVNNKKILDDINIKIPSTGLTIISGKSGSGKTTLLNVINSLDNDYDGEVLYDGRKLSVEDFSNVFQDYNLFEELTVIENLSIYNNLKEVDELLEKLNIKSLKNKKVYTLSGGEKRRVSIARALLKKSKIMILDEPTSSLDEENTKNVLNILKDYSKNHLVIISTHEIIQPEIIDSYIEIIAGKAQIKYIKGSNNLALNESITINNSFINKITNLFFTRYKLSSFLSILFMSILISFVLFSSFMCKFDFAKIQAKTNEKEENNILVYYSNDENKYTGVRYYDDKYYNLSINTNMDVPFYYLYVPNCNYFVYNDDFLTGDIIGNIPTAKNEIMIYQILAEMIMYYGILTDNGIYKPNNMNDIIGKSVRINDINVSISGIILNDLSSYSNLKNDYNLELNLEKNMFASKYDYYKNMILVSNDFDSYMNEFITNKKSKLTNISYIVKNDYQEQLNVLEKIKIDNSRFPKKLDIIGTFYSDIIADTLYFPYIVSNVIKLISPLIMIVFIIFVVMFVENILVKNNKEIGILVILGFKKKDINKLIISYIIKYILYSLLLSGILLSFASISLNLYYSKVVEFYLHPFIFNFELLYPLVILFTTLIICIIVIIKNNKKNYIMEVRND